MSLLPRCEGQPALSLTGCLLFAAPVLDLWWVSGQRKGITETYGKFLSSWARLQDRARNRGFAALWSAWAWRLLARSAVRPFLLYRIEAAGRKLLREAARTRWLWALWLSRDRVAQRPGEAGELARRPPPRNLIHTTPPWSYLRNLFVPAHWYDRGVIWVGVSEEEEPEEEPPAR